MSINLGGIIKSAPAGPGVYVFRRGKAPIYIGKAADLKKRLASYFRANASDKVRRLREEATALEWIETASDIEALIREAELIKRHLPKYNVLMRDDKSYFYAAITQEEFPRIFTAHKTQLEGKKLRRVIGPFTSGSALRAVLKMLRRAFPYCTCAIPHKRPCLNAQIGRCLGYCCIREDQKARSRSHAEYKKNIKNIIAVLSGKRKRIAAGLRRSMRAAAKKQDFELAARIRDQWEALENVFAHRPLFEVELQTGGGRFSDREWRAIEKVIRTLLDASRRIRRVEGYDISNISGVDATGSMVVFVNGRPVKSLYRKFKIKTVRGANDVAMHREVLRRRIAHPEWQYPDIIVMDGGKPQLNAASAALSKFKIQSSKFKTPRIAALAKREEELYIEGKATPVRLDSLPRPVMHFFQRVRDESHRFAKKYHHKLREIDLREQATHK